MSTSERPRLTRPVHWLAFAGGAGLAPRAPGTFGTAAAVPLYLLLEPLPLTAYLALVGLLFLVGIPVCGRTARDLGVHDHPGIVWDEVVGYLVTMAAAPPGWGSVVVGFLLFRLFDILKPWPIGVLDRRLRGGLGIMADDLLAGVFAALVLASVWPLVAGGLS